MYLWVIFRDDSDLVMLKWSIPLDVLLNILFGWCSYVLASYARFLWDAEEEEEEEEEEEDIKESSKPMPSRFFHEVSAIPTPPIAAAS